MPPQAGIPPGGLEVTMATTIVRRHHDFWRSTWLGIRTTVVVAWLVILLALGGIMVAGTYTIPRYPVQHTPGDLPSPRAPV
jgi:hypothetical protein